MAKIPMAFDSPYNKVDVISTGLPQLDRILGIGGIPFGRITECSGTWSVGKTTLALSIIKEAQKKNIQCVWYDAEWSYEELYARALGVDTKKLGLLQGRTAEESLDKILEFLEEEENSLIVIDSIGGLHPREETEKQSGDRTIGSQAALVSRFCRKVFPLLAMNHNALLVLNHEYIPIMSTGGRPTVQTSGGAKLNYGKSIWIRLSKMGVNLNQGDTPVGFKVEAEIRKNKLAATQKQSCELELFYGRGFSAVSDQFQDELTSGVIEKRGNTYYRGEVKIGVGVARAKEWLNANK